MISSRIRLPAMLMAVFALTAACSVNIDLGDEVTGSGDVETRMYDLSGFEDLDISSAFNVEVTVVPDGDYQVEVTIDDNLFDELVVDVRGDRLRLGTQGGSSIRTNNGLKATVVMPGLSEVDASGASDVVVDAGYTAVGDLQATGASEIRVVALDSGDMTIDVSGASSVDLSGVKAESLDISASGASDVELGRLAIDSADVSVSGASDVEFGSANSVTGSLSGASSIQVESGTNVDVDSSGGSSVDTY